MDKVELSGAMQSMIRSGVYNIVGAAIRLFLSLLTIPLLTRLIGLDGYGLLSFVIAVIGVITLADAGLSLSTTVFAARDLSTDNPQDLMETLTVTLLMMLVLASLAAVILLLAAYPLSGLLPDLSPGQRNDLACALALGAPVIWARLHQQVLIGLKQAYNRFGLINILQTTQTGALTLGWLLIAWRGGGIVLLMVWQVVVTLAFLVLHSIYGLRLLRGVALRCVWTRPKAISIIRYSLTTWIGLLGSSLFSHIDRLVVGAILGSSMMGFYAAVTSVAAQINALSAMLVQPYFPVITQMLMNRAANLSQLREQVRHAIAMNTAGSLGIGTMLLACSALILPVLIPGASIDLLTAFRILIVIYSLYSMNAVGTYVLFGADLIRLSSILILCCGLATLGLITLGALSFGIVGSTVGNAGYIGTLAVYWFSMQQLVLTRWEWMAWIRVPLGIFFGGSALILPLPHRADLPLLIGIVQICALSAWFMLTERTLVQQVLRRLFPTRL